MLCAGGIDGGRRESPSGIGPIYGGRFRPLRRVDYLGSSHGNAAYAFNRRGDFDPPLTGQDGNFFVWREWSAFYLFVSGSGAADGVNGINQAGPIVIAQENIHEIVFADIDELSHSARIDRPFQTLIAAKKAIGRSYSGNKQDLAAHRRRCNGGSKY